MDTILLATKNKGKIKEMRDIIKNVNITSLDDFDIEEPKETGSTFAENSSLKAKYYGEKLKISAIADDSGLCVDGLNNFPGIYSARYAGTHNDDDNNKLLIKNLQGIENRRARYVCAICVYYPDGKYLITRGEVEGIIIDTPRGKNGFGYDPYFYIEDFKKTFAEVDLSLKNTISHRARAIRKMKELLNEDFTYKR